MPHDILAPSDIQVPAAATRSWYRELTREHWFVLVAAALGWMFDTMDQQLFTLARRPGRSCSGPSMATLDDARALAAGGGSARIQR